MQKKYIPLYIVIGLALLVAGAVGYWLITDVLPNVSFPEISFPEQGKPDKDDEPTVVRPTGNDGYIQAGEASGFTRDMAATNNLVNPELFDADDNAEGHAMGYHDIGVNSGQIGIAFGVNLTWDGYVIPGDHCEMVVLTPGWYENFGIENGRWEVYDVPSSDYPGWVEVLVEQRVEEQARHYGCPTTDNHVRLFMSQPDTWKTMWTTWR